MLKVAPDMTLVWPFFMRSQPEIFSLGRHEKLKNK